MALTAASAALAFTSAAAQPPPPMPPLPKQQPLPKTQLQVIGSFSGLPLYKDIEHPFWTRTLHERSAGAVGADIRAFDDMGLSSPEVLRLMAQGVLEIGATSPGDLAADDAAQQMSDIAGLVPDAATARRVGEALRPGLARVYKDKLGLELLGVAAYPAQVLYCNGELKGLADMKGRKVRTANRSQADLVQALAGTPVPLALAEVLPALQGKTVDCAIGGSLAGNLARWHEVTTHLLALPLSWSPIVYAANARTWARYDPRVRTLVAAEMPTLEGSIWNAAEHLTRQGYECNAGTDRCTAGTKGRMKVVQPAESDRELLKKAIEAVTVPRWAARCSAACVAEFNATIGKIVGLTAKK
jgi:TRAP-type C4-dicarboxylate transport system substrate-binding protein